MHPLLSDTAVSSSVVHCLPAEQQQFLPWIAFGFFCGVVGVVVGGGVV